MYSRLEDGITLGAFGQLMYDEPYGCHTVLLGLLGDNYWGDIALAVDSCVRHALACGGSLGGA